MKYRILGEPLPVVTCELEQNEMMITESGSMCWMSPNMQMETVGGGFAKAFGRMFTGEALFQNHYTARGGAGSIAFASSFPGSIRAIEVAPGKDMILQKSAFLASTAGVELSVHFRKNFATGFFGGEGFIMQRISGTGLCFLEIDGYAVDYELAAGQSMVIDTGYLAAMDSTCTMTLQQVPGVKNVLFGGEGLFNTLVTGPGRIIMQTMPISGVASALRAYLPTSSN